MTKVPLNPTSTLSYLAAISGSKSGTSKPKLNLIGRGTTWAWEGERHLGLFNPDSSKRDAIKNRGAGDRMASLDALQPADNILRAGWLWIAGKILDSEGTKRTHCFPVLSTSVILKRGDLRQGLTNRMVVPVGDLEASPLLGSSALALDHRQLLSSIDGCPTSVTREYFAELLGQPIDLAYDQARDPAFHSKHDGLAIISGVGIYTSDQQQTFDLSGRLNDWKDQDLSDTSFDHLYSPAPPASANANTAANAKTAANNSVWPYPTRPLNPVQANIITASAREKIITVSGPPGTGKTYTMVEMALAATARGESVLLAASSPHAVDVIAKHFESSPGPSPITFGGHRASDTESQISRRLNSTSTPLSVSQTRSDQERSADLATRQRLSISNLLGAETVASTMSGDPAARVSLASRFPESIDLNRITKLLRIARVRGVIGGFLDQRKLAKASEELGLPASTTREQIRSRVRDLREFRLASRVIADGGLTLENSFDNLTDLEVRSQLATGKRLDALSQKALASERSGRQALVAISTAVRSSRAKRREILTSLAESSLTEAAPLWLGLVRDIDDVLPAKPAMFDLVILDEASQIDQASAAGALLRAKRAVVCGDPNQLRHVSFVSDDLMREKMAETIGASHLALDVRRNSVFDVASGAGIGFGLDEHFRCVPHLINFSARRFYDNHLKVATTNPLNHSTDRVEVIDVPGCRNSDKVNEAQIKVALEQVRKAASRSSGDTSSSIGVVSPFRDQVDALTEAVLEELRPEQIEDMGLSIGTVHSFQGSEHDTIIVMLAIGEGEATNSWTFVNNPNLLNVMVTRAKQTMIVLNSCPSPPGLIGEYLVYADPLLSKLESTPHSASWPKTVTEALTEAGLTHWANYVVGSHTVDFALWSPEKLVALIVEPHPDGPDAHIERDLFLRRMGWTVRDAFCSRWSDRLGELTTSLVTQGVSFEP